MQDEPRPLPEVLWMDSHLDELKASGRLLAAKNVRATGHFTGNFFGKISNKPGSFRLGATFWIQKKRITAQARVKFAPNSPQAQLL